MTTPSGEHAELIEQSSIKRSRTVDLLLTLVHPAEEAGQQDEAWLEELRNVYRQKSRILPCRRMKSSERNERV